MPEEKKTTVYTCGSTDKVTITITVTTNTPPAEEEQARRLMEHLRRYKRNHG